MTATHKFPMPTVSFGLTTSVPPNWAHGFAHVDYRRRLALVADRDLAWRPELIGVTRYEASDEEATAEVAIVVQDYWQGQGLGAILLREILCAGVANGTRRFRAHVLADNWRALAMLSRWTDIQQRQTEGGVTSLLFTPRSGDSGSVKGRRH